MEFRTIIDIQSSEIKINHQQKLMVFGSCFAENIGKQLLNHKFEVTLNPFGILYNPLSISQAFHFLLTDKKFSKNDIVEYQDCFHSFYHHSSFSNTNPDLFLKHINSTRIENSKNLKQTDILLITFGSAYIYTLKESGNVVANCHKFPSSFFDHSRLSISQITDTWHPLITKLRVINPDLQIIFTVSPIRHWKDGAHNNQLSKATLLLAIDELISKHRNTYYFPSYEIVLDELRDYRFYSEDMIHPNDITIHYLWERFSQTYFEKQTIELNKKWQSILKAINHRPFNEHTEKHKQFLRQTLLKISDLRRKYPYFYCEKEINYITNKLGLDI